MAQKNQEYKERNLQFLEDFKMRPDAHELFNGVLYRVITKGNGPKPSPKSVVSVYYKGTLINGKPFDAAPRGGRPATFKLSELILGWRTALREMPVGSRWEVVIPFHLAYGARGAGAIKPFSTLVFDIQLVAII